MYNEDTSREAGQLRALGAMLLFGVVVLIALAAGFGWFSAPPGAISAPAELSGQRQDNLSALTIRPKEQSEGNIPEVKVESVSDSPENADIDRDPADLMAGAVEAAEASAEPPEPEAAPAPAPRRTPRRQPPQPEAASAPEPAPEPAPAPTPEPVITGAGQDAAPTSGGSGSSFRTSDTKDPWGD